MKTSRNLLIAVSVLAVECTFERAGVERTAPVAGPMSSLHEALAQLDLSDAQRERIEALRRSEQARIETLQRAHRIAEASLREAEVRQPFDSARVGTLLQREAEISAYLRGTESRLVSAIFELLEPRQRSAFAALRSGSASGEIVGRAVGTANAPSI
jgi:Spy/CpxP family protein refolding chaperone